MSDYRYALAALMGWTLVAGGCDADVDRDLPASRPAEKSIEPQAAEPPPKPNSPAPIHVDSPEPPPATTVEAAGHVEVIMTDVPDVSELQLTSRDYYVSTLQGRILRVQRSSGAQTMSLDDVSANRLAVDDDALFYATLQGLFRVGHDTDTPEPLLDIEDFEELDGILGLALDHDFIYFTPFQNPGIFRMPKAGGDVEKLSSQKRAGGLALTETHVYFASFFRNRIGRLAKSGGRIETVVASAGGPVAMAIDGPLIVALMETTADVVAVDATSRKRRRLADAGKNPTELVLSGGDVYWSTGKSAPEDPTFIRRVPMAGGPTETLVRDAGPLSLLQLDGDWLYFSPTREASILRLDVSGG